MLQPLDSPLSYFLICHIVIPGAFPPARFPFAHLLPPWQTPVLPRDSARTSLREDSVPHGPRAVVGVCISKTRPASLQRKERVPPRAAWARYLQGSPQVLNELWVAVAISVPLDWSKPQAKRYGRGTDSFKALGVILDAPIPFSSISNQSPSPA